MPHLKSCYVAKLRLEGDQEYKGRVIAFGIDAI
jgi:hypothetical protein